MVSIQQEGPLTIFQMGREIFHKVLYPVFAFLIEDVLIDTGSKSARKHILPIWDKYDIHRIINTHAHEDHIGNNCALQLTHDIPIFAHEKAREAIEHPENVRFQFYEKIMWGIPKESKVQPIPDTIKGEKFKLNVIHTPGHSPGHICLYEPTQKWLFSGDLFFGTKIFYLRTLEEFQPQLDSLKKLAQLDISTIFCSFRGKIQNGNEKIQKKITYMKELKQNVLDLHEQGDSPKKIRRKLLGREDHMRYMTNNDFTKQHLVDRILLENRKC
jgi:glyoxylase-like metal-dependent hydrolase (beta-lactamase superfamily II)